MLAPAQEVPMIEDLFPRAHRRYSALPLFGAIAADFTRWLYEQGLRRQTRRQHLRAMVRIDRALRRRGVKQLQQIALDDLRTCWRGVRPCRAHLAAAANALEGFLSERSLVTPCSPRPPSQTATQIERYASYLRDVRGLCEPTIHQHVVTASELLDHVHYEGNPSALSAMTTSDLETFVRTAGRRVGHETLQHVIGRIRGFLRFLVFAGTIPAGLERQIDTPRCYRLERLPRSLPWETVRALLDAIDRTTPTGLRDYTMLFLSATYGLRACEIVALTLDAIDWRAQVLHVPARKRASSRVLPLTDPVGTLLIDYLRRARPPSGHRELFLRARGPAGRLKPTAVSNVFQTHVKRSGLPIPFHGPHCLRHACAIHLLREGTSLKAIGDLLGHRTAESTCVYLRLAVTDLRAVPLSVPAAAALQGVQR
jgi:integrase/recombinase XerD